MNKLNHPSLESHESSKREAKQANPLKPMSKSESKST